MISPVDSLRPSSCDFSQGRMSSRPVPRRESPWGLPEGDTRQPQAHRCNDRAEDVIQVEAFRQPHFLGIFLGILMTFFFVLSHLCGPGVYLSTTTLGSFTPYSIKSLTYEQLSSEYKSRQLVFIYSTYSLVFSAIVVYICMETQKEFVGL